MHLIICDLCGKEVRHGTTIEIERPFGQFGLPDEETLHLHTECDIRLRNNFNDFVKKVREENGVE